MLLRLLFKVIVPALFIIFNPVPALLVMVFPVMVTVLGELPCIVIVNPFPEEPIIVFPITVFVTLQPLQFVPMLIPALHTARGDARRKTSMPENHRADFIVINVSFLKNESSH